MILVVPKKSNLFDIEWTRENSIFRSSMWTAVGEDQWKPVSLGYKKFFNYGEKSVLIHPPENLEGVSAVEKIDGSSLLVSKFRGKLIVRTRGTWDVSTLPNGGEIAKIIELNPRAFSNDWVDSEDHTLVFEWTTPSNCIIINYGHEPKLWLTNCIRHEDYSYLPQWKLDQIAGAIGALRPKRISCSDFDLKGLIQEIGGWKDSEGICLYYHDDQEIVKIKSKDYIQKHSIRSGCSLGALVEMFVEFGKSAFPSNEEEFFSALNSKFGSVVDWETIGSARDHAESILSAHSKIRTKMMEIYSYLNEVSDRIGKWSADDSQKRKAWALEIQGGKFSKYSALCFCIIMQHMEKFNMEKAIIETINRGEF